MLSVSEVHTCIVYAQMTSISVVEDDCAPGSCASRCTVGSVEKLLIPAWGTHMQL